MMGDTPTTVLAATAALMPGTARMVPMLTTGLDGGNSTTSAASMASSTPGAGRARSAPDAMICAAGVAACMRTHHSWKCTTRSFSRGERSPRDPPCSWGGSPPPRTPASTTWVSTGSSDIGSSRTPGCHRRQSASVTADSGSPAASSWLRRMWVAKSLSPSVNQSGLAP